MNKRRRLDPFAAMQADVAKILDRLDLLLHRTDPRKAAQRDPSIAGFCKRKGISRSLYNKLRKQDKGPRESAAGLRRTITPEAESDWDREREAEAVALRRDSVMLGDVLDD